MSKYTPGPWRLKEPISTGDQPQRIEDYREIPIASTYPENAALIAAAPELLDSLKELAFIVETVAHLQHRERELLPAAEKARAIIAKGEGN